MRTGTELVKAPDKALIVGIVGAGVMGRGVAAAIAEHGHRALLLDLNEETLKRAEAEIRSHLRARALAGLLRSTTPRAVLDRLQFSTVYDGFASIDFVVENVVESLETKRSVYSMICNNCGEDVVIAANTSTFPITEIAELATNPQRVIGIHFMNPASTRMLVEIIPGQATSDSTLQTALNFLEQIGKKGVVVADTPGFVSNRILMLTINEAIQVVERGGASAADVDRIFEGCFGHAMGPLATADLIGLDTILLSLESLRARLGDPKFIAAALLRTMVATGRIGRKSGSGFFSYGG
jgi:3-hydroxybutyryl-CoA dehydrogenase